MPRPRPSPPHPPPPPPPRQGVLGPCGTAPWGNRVERGKGEGCRLAIRARRLPFCRSTRAPASQPWVRELLISVISWFLISSECYSTSYLLYWGSHLVFFFHQNVVWQLREVMNLDEQLEKKKTETQRLQTSRPTIHLLDWRHRRDLEIKSDETSKHREYF